jgi:hypothetical protein
MAQFTWTTSPKVIKGEISTLQTEFQHLLGEHLLGIYLIGSLALGGFNPERSDLDIIVFTNASTILDTKRKLIELFQRVSKAPCPIDIWFLVQNTDLSLQYPPAFDLHYDEKLRSNYEQDLRTADWRHWDDQEKRDSSLAISLTVLRRKGIVLYGQPVGRICPVIPESMFREALLEAFQASRQALLSDPVSFVLNACRTYAYLLDGEIRSKDEGGNWGLAYLPEQYQALIQQSLALYRSERLGRPVGRATLEAFAVYINEEIQQRFS